MIMKCQPVLPAAAVKISICSSSESGRGSCLEVNASGPSGSEAPKENRRARLPNSASTNGNSSTSCRPAGCALVSMISPFPTSPALQLATEKAAKRLTLAALGEPDHVEHAPAVLVGEESVRARGDVFERLLALGNGRLEQERTEVYAYPAQGLEGSPRPLVGGLGDQVFVAERPATLRARGHELEGIPFREILGAGDQDVVADLALLVRLPELRVPLGEGRQRRRVLGAQRPVDRLPDP